jgi:hypothetical protein
MPGIIAVPDDLPISQALEELHSQEALRVAYRVGLMFRLRWKKLVGSYLFLSATRRG